MNLHYPITLDFSKNQHIEIEITKDSKNTILLDIYPVFSNKHSALVEVSEASVKGVTSKGKIIFDETAIVNNEYILYRINETILKSTGKTTCVMQLLDRNANVINSFEFYVYVVNQMYDENDYVSDEDLIGFRGYKIRAEQAADRAEELADDVRVKVIELHDAIEKADKAGTQFNEKVTELEERIQNGEFTGARGPQGNDGSNAVIAESDGFIAFDIEDGDLIMYYTGDNAPDCYIDENGCLVYNYGGET